MRSITDSPKEGIPFCILSTFRAGPGTKSRLTEYWWSGILVELFQILKDDAVKNAALNMPADLENSAVATGLEKVSFISIPKERQCQRMLKLPHNCTHLTC